MMTIFKEIKLVDVLNWIPNIKRVKPIDIEMYRIESDETYPFFGQSLTNNGIIEYISIDSRFLNNLERNVYLLVASNNHSINIVTEPFYLKEDHAATSTIGHEKMTLRAALYIKSSIFHVFDRIFDYNAKATQDILKNTVVTLPFVNDNERELDWAYMEQYVKRMEEQYVKRIEEQYTKHVNDYLNLLGLATIEHSNLTVEELNFLRTYNVSNFKNVKIDKFFNINTTKKKFNARDVTFVETGHPYVVRSNENNGIRGYIIEDEEFLNEGRTISFGQDTATVFYQEVPYFTGDKIKVLTPKFHGLNSKNANFFLTVMRRAFSQFSWGSSSFNVDVLKNVEIPIPLMQDSDSEPDLHLMEKYINILQKKFVAKLHTQLTKEVAAYKKVIHR